MHERLRGESWDAEIERSGARPTGRAARIVTDHCAALDAVQRAGIIVHRDLKTEHVCVLTEGTR